MLAKIQNIISKTIYLCKLIVPSYYTIEYEEKGFTCTYSRFSFSIARTVGCCKLKSCFCFPVAFSLICQAWKTFILQQDCLSPAVQLYLPVVNILFSVVYSVVFFQIKAVLSPKVVHLCKTSGAYPITSGLHRCVSYKQVLRTALADLPPPCPVHDKLSNKCSFLNHYYNLNIFKVML